MNQRKVEVDLFHDGKIYQSDLIPDSVLMHSGRFALIREAPSKEKLVLWAKGGTTEPCVLEGVIQVKPSRAFLVVAYGAKSGFDSWNVHLFLKGDDGTYKARLLIQDIVFRARTFRIVAAKMPDTNSLQLLDQDGKIVYRAKW